MQAKHAKNQGSCLQSENLGSAEISGSHGNAGENTTNLPGNSEKGLENALANGKGNKYGIYKHLAKEGYSVDEGGNIVVDAGDGGAAPITKLKGSASLCFFL